MSPQAGGQTPNKTKPKVQEEGDQRDTMMSMISMASSESTVAGLMSLSAPPSSSSERTVAGSAATWSGRGSGMSEPAPAASEVHTPAKVSLSEYRAKNADVLAAQKRKLENMEASVKREYANAAQALIGQQQQRKDRQHQQATPSSDVSNPSPIILKIPLEKERHDRSSLKMRFPVATGGGTGSRVQDQDIKVKIRVPEKQRGSSSEGRDKYKERSNHHHHQHHQHHQHHHHSSSSASLSSSSSSHKHSSSKVPSDSTRTSSSSSSSTSSRKRTHSQQDTPGPSKVAKSSRNPYQLPTLGHAAELLPTLSLPHHQGSYSHSKGDKRDTNGHGSAAGTAAGPGGQSNEFQDTFEMLNSLLSAQGVQPAPPSVFDYRSQYGADYRFSAGSRGANARPPPLPAEPPPPLPPLPK